MFCMTIFAANSEYVSVPSQPPCWPLDIPRRVTLRSSAPSLQPAQAVHVDVAGRNLALSGGDTFISTIENVLTPF
jgi:hypothetical protein